MGHPHPTPECKYFLLLPHQASCRPGTTTGGDFPHAKKLHKERKTNEVMIFESGVLSPITTSPHKPSDREFILNWVCPAEIDHITLSLLMKASLESLSDILYCYLFQFLVAREWGPSDTLSSATDGKGAKKTRWQNSPSLPAKQLAPPNQEL